MSALGSVDVGVPQGSVLRPLLFCVYIICIKNLLCHYKAYFYADDSQLLHTFLPSEVDYANQLIIMYLQSLLEISNDHQLTIHFQKYKVPIFGKKRNNIKDMIKIKISDQVLPCSTFALNLYHRVIANKIRSICTIRSRLD